MISSLFWDIAQRTLAFTDVSGQPIGLILKGQCLTILRSPVDTGSVLTYSSWLQYANLHLFIANKTVNSSDVRDTTLISSLKTVLCVTQSVHWCTATEDHLKYRLSLLRFLQYRLRALPFL